MLEVCISGLIVGFIAAALFYSVMFVTILIVKRNIKQSVNLFFEIM